MRPVAAAATAGQAAACGGEEQIALDRLKRKLQQSHADPPLSLGRQISVPSPQGRGREGAFPQTPTLAGDAINPAASRVGGKPDCAILSDADLANAPKFAPEQLLFADDFAALQIQPRNQLILPNVSGVIATIWN